MSKSTCFRLGWFVAALQFSVGAAFGQWTAQTLPMQPGWNAVYLEIQPEPAECDHLFAGLPVERVWGWNRRFSPVQFIQDPTILTPANPDWLLYLPPTHRLAGEMNLFSLHAGKCYLIKLAQNAPPTNWTIRGKAVLRKTEWASDSLNLAGFRLPVGSPPTFQSFFSGSTNHLAGPFYRLSVAGSWQQISALFPMRAGEALWVRTQGQSDYSGPLDVELEQSTGLDYGRVLQEQPLRIRNRSSSAKTITLRMLPSDPPASTDEPALAGGVPLAYWFSDLDNNLFGWTNVPSALVYSNLPPGGEWTLRLAVRRADMVPYGGPVGPAGALYQSILEVTDAAGVARVWVPVTAEGLETSGGAVDLAGRGRTKSPGGTPLRPGLWIGGVVVNQVSQPASYNPTQPEATPAEFQFRLLVHVDEGGTVRLLQRVLQMFQEGTLKPDPNDPTKLVVDRPGRYVLVTDESLIPQIPNLTGATLRDGTPVGRRFSSAAFGFRSPKIMTGAGGTLGCTVGLDYDDALNPFKHAYHPDHNNLDERYEQKVPEGRESFTVTRQIRLEFTAQDPDGLVLAGWGDNQLGGIYRETLTGLHKDPIHVQGTFRLHLASRVDVLNAIQ